MLYLALELVNDTHRTQVISAAQGQLQFNGQQWPWAFTAANEADGVAVPARARRQIQVAVPLVPADSLRQLRAALAIGSQIDNSLRLIIQVDYSGKHNADAPDHLYGYQYLQRLPPLPSK